AHSSICIIKNGFESDMYIHARVYVSGYAADISIWNTCGRSEEAFSFSHGIHEDGALANLADIKQGKQSMHSLLNLR
ncbi:hypothetical protein ACJX0J_012175, partial [Zea mays]